MDVNLLRAIRLSKLRIEPTIKRQASKAPLREKYMRYLRVLTPLAEIPYSLPNKFKWYLNGSIDRNSKTGAVYYELIEVGVEPSSIWHKELNQKPVFKKFIWSFRRLYLVLGILIYRFKQLQKLDLASLQVVIGYMAYKSFFKSHPSLKPIIISDISPLLHMQWAGALAVSRQVIWWQDDYHHFEGFSEENYSPYECGFAAVLNEYGYQTVKKKSPKAKVFRRKQTKVSPLREVPNPPKVGLATNVLFQATPSELEEVQNLKKRLKLKKILLRLHPNSKLHHTKSLPQWIDVAEKSETLEEFAQRVDLVVVGNTAAQLKLLCLGVPVIHVNLFDSFGFDLYQYCRLGISYGVENPYKVNLEDVCKFYSDRFKPRSLQKYVDVQSKIAELKDFPKT